MAGLLDRLRHTTRTGADIQPFVSSSFANRRLKPRPWPPVQQNNRSRRRNSPASENDAAVDAWLVRLNARLQRLDHAEESDHSSDRTSGSPTDRVDPDISSPLLPLLCSICFEASNKFPEVSPTAHCIHPPNICEPCLEQYVSHAILDRGSTIPRCPGLECTQTMTYADILRAVKGNRECLDRYESLVLRSTLSREPNFIWCKNSACDWGQVHKDKSASQIVTCRGCGARACFTHDAPWHVGLTCEQYDAKTGRLDPASKEYIEKHTKKCPNKSCGRPIEKVSGCDHMTCRLPGGCGHEFCWNCLTDYAMIRKKGIQSHDPTCRHHPRFRRNATTAARRLHNPPPAPVPPQNQPTRPVVRRLVERLRSAVRRSERPAPPVVNAAPGLPNQPARPRSVLHRLTERIRPLSRRPASWPRRTVHATMPDIQAEIIRPVTPIAVLRPEDPVVVALAAPARAPLPAPAPAPTRPSHPVPLVVSRPVERTRPAIARPIDQPVVCQVPTPTNHLPRPSVAKRIARYPCILVPRRRVRSINPLVITCWLFWGSGIGTTSLILCLAYFSLLVFGDTKLVSKGRVM